MLIYLILGVDFLVGQVGDGHFIVGGFPDLMLWPLVGFARVQKISQGFIVYFNKAGSKRVLQINMSNTIRSSNIQANTQLDKQIL